MWLSPGFGGIGYLLLVYVQTVSVIISVFPTLPSTLVGGTLAVNWCRIAEFQLNFASIPPHLETSKDEIHLKYNDKSRVINFQ